MSFFIHTLLAAGSIPALVLGAPVQSVPLMSRVGTVDTPYPDTSFPEPLSKRAVDVYRMYTGTVQSTWPSMDQWVSSFDEMFDANREVINGGCTQFQVAANSNQETADIGTGIQQVASETGVDSRFILAIMLQESNGCVRAPTTNYGVRNPGLMQDHDGSATCNDKGVIQNPCPTNTIVQMIRDGVAGTPAGDGLVQTMKDASASGTSKYYVSARIYNSGSLASSGDLGAGVATHCYVSDVANRLTGWVYAKKGCSLDGGSYDASPAPPPPAPRPAAPPAVAASIPKPAPAPVPAPASPVPIKAPSPPAQPAVQHNAPTVPAVSKAVSSKLAPGVTTNCAKYYNVQGGDFCLKLSDKFGISFDQFRTLNTQLDGGCSNLWLGYDYCVQGL